MTLPELSIKRHVLAFMLNGVLVLFGFIGYQKLGIDRFPNIEFPLISVATVQQGANPSVVDASITNIIESKVNTIPGINHIQSTSSPGVSIVTITFDLNKDIDVAFNEVQAKINQVLRQLPDDADPPVVAKVETNASPIMWLSLQGDRTQQQLNQFARTVLKKKLETISGVGEVRVGGRRDRTIRINVSPDRMAAFDLTTQDLFAAFAEEHLQLSGGFLVSGNHENVLKLDLEFHRLDELRELVVAYRAGAPVKLKDIANIEDGLGDYRQLARYNGTPSAGLGIVKIANTNTVAIIDEVQRRFNTEIIPQLPPGMKIEVASNDATFIREMVNTLQEHIVSGTVLASLVVLFFLGSWRSTLIIALAIPVSLFGAIAVMYFAGYTFNALTLLALLLLIGVVVDDAIVVLENIYRHRENIDPEPMSAAINGSREVFFAVLAATLALVSIFAPVIFMGGIIGKFFESFAVVVTFGVLVSLFVSITLTPMLCARYLKVSGRRGGRLAVLDKFHDRLDKVYRSLLDRALIHRWKTVALTILLVLPSVWFFMDIGREFVPEEDEGRFIVRFKTPMGSGIQYTDGRLKNIEAVLAKHEEIQSYFAAIGLGEAGQVNKGMSFVRMVPREKRTVKQYELIPALRQELNQIPGVQAFVEPVPIVSGPSAKLVFSLSGPNLQQVAKLSQELLQKLGSDPGFGRVDLDLQLNMPELALDVDRVRAASLGLSTRNVGQAVSVFAGGLDIAKYNDEPGDGERYDVRLKAVEGDFRQAADLSRIYLRSGSGELVRLDTVARFKQQLGPAVISRLDLQYAGNFFASPTLPLGEAVERIRTSAAEILPPGYGIKLQGEAEEFEKTKGYMSFAFALALLLLYMVLASQFNSLRQPLIIMVAQPLAIIGGVLALWLTNETLNIYSMIGLVLLIGLVAKNSILLVDLTNQLRAKGMEIDAALRQACPIRMRPVLMTFFTVILALLPAASGFGAGAETNGPLAIAVIGGMITSTLLTLVVVPAVYSLAAPGREPTVVAEAPVSQTIPAR